MALRARQVTIGGRPMIGLTADGGFMIAIDQADTMKLIADLQRELRAAQQTKDD